MPVREESDPGGREAVKRVIWRRRRLKNIAAISAAGEG